MVRRPFCRCWARKPGEAERSGPAVRPRYPVLRHGASAQGTRFINNLRQCREDAVLLGIAQLRMHGKLQRARRDRLGARQLGVDPAVGRLEMRGHHAAPGRDAEIVEPVHDGVARDARGLSQGDLVALPVRLEPVGQYGGTKSGWFPSAAV